MGPFRFSGSGGSHVRVADVGLSGVAWKFTGELMGTAWQENSKKSNLTWVCCWMAINLVECGSRLFLAASIIMPSTMKLLDSQHQPHSDNVNVTATHVHAHYTYGISLIKLGLQQLYVFHYSVQVLSVEAGNMSSGLIYPPLFLCMHIKFQFA